MGMSASLPFPDTICKPGPVHSSQPITVFLPCAPHTPHHSPDRTGKLKNRRGTGSRIGVSPPVPQTQTTRLLVSVARNESSPGPTGGEEGWDRTLRSGCPHSLVEGKRVNSSVFDLVFMCPLLHLFLLLLYNTVALGQEQTSPRRFFFFFFKALGPVKHECE